MAPLPQLFTLGALATLCGTCYAAGNTGSVRMGWVPTGFRSSTDRVASRPAARLDRPSPFVLSRPERAMTVVRQADIGKVLADEIYAPMFVQALLLSFSGIVGACLLAFIIKFKGEDLQKILVEEAYSETTALKEKLGATEDKEGEILVGFKGAAEEKASEEAAAPAPVAVEQKEAPAPARPKELVSAGGKADALGDDYDD